MKKEKIKSLMMSVGMVFFTAGVISLSDGLAWRGPIWHFIGMMAFYPFISLLRPENDNNS